MPMFQVTCRELVYIDRIYEIEAETADDASSQIEESKGEAGALVDEQVQGSYEFCDVGSVSDENGNPA